MPPCRRPIGGSWGRPIGGSSRSRRIVRSADDKLTSRFYAHVREAHRTAPAVRPAGSLPRAFDRALAVVCSCSVSCRSGWAIRRRTSRSLMAVATLPMYLTVAFRRPYPALPGFVAQALVAAQFAIWGGVEVIPYSIAWGCAIYGLTIWTPPRVFARPWCSSTVTNLPARRRPATSPTASPSQSSSPRRCCWCGAWSAIASAARSWPSASATWRRVRRWSRSARGSRASCTMRSPTTSRSWSCRRERSVARSTSRTRAPARCSRRSSAPGAARSPRCGACSGCCRDESGRPAPPAAGPGRRADAGRPAARRGTCRATADRRRAP